LSLNRWTINGRSYAKINLIYTIDKAVDLGQRLLQFGYDDTKSDTKSDTKLGLIKLSYHLYHSYHENKKYKNIVKKWYDII